MTWEAFLEEVALKESLARESVLSSLTLEISLDLRMEETLEKAWELRPRGLDLSRAV